MMVGVVFICGSRYDVAIYTLSAVRKQTEQLVYTPQCYLSDPLLPVKIYSLKVSQPPKSYPRWGISTEGYELVGLFHIPNQYLSSSLLCFN